jgi:uncharacterized protein (UPF0548 family)
VAARRPTVPTPWRFFRGWSEPELQRQLDALAERPVTVGNALVEPVPAPGWTVEQLDTQIGQEAPGPPLTNGPFARARQALTEYRFADPRITHGHYDPQTPLLGRDILVDVHALFIRMLVGLRIGDVVDRADASETRFGIRLDTLSGHILDGLEWIQVAKDHRTGAITLRIAVQWRPGRLPTWWMGLGFRLLGRQVQQRWRRQATRRLRRISQE